MESKKISNAFSEKFKENTEKYQQLLRREMDDALDWMIAYQHEKLIAQGQEKHRKVRKMQEGLDKAKARYEKAKQEYLSKENPSIDDWLTI